MNKLLLVFLITVAAGAALFYNHSARQKYNSQVILAQELHKAMEAMMGDLRQAGVKSVTGVPADGQWYHEVTFSTPGNASIQYRLNGGAGNELNRISSGSMKKIATHIGALNLRRQADNDSVIEVQLQARNSLLLTSNFKIRMHE